MQRVVTVAGNSVVGTQGGRLNGPCYRREEGYPWLGGTRAAQRSGKRWLLAEKKRCKLGRSPLS